MVNSAFATAPRGKLPKNLVHRLHESEAFLRHPITDDDHLVFGFSIPEDHELFTGETESPPLILMLELIRQLSIATSHIYGGVSILFHAISRKLQFEWNSVPISVAALNSDRASAIVTPEILERDAMGTSAMTFAIRVMYYGKEVARGSCSALRATPHEYKKSRGRHWAYTSVNSKQSTQFLSSAASTTRVLSANLEWNCLNTFYFDHPTDHVPGMVLAGAALECWETLNPSLPPHSITMSFTKYAELDSEIRVRATTRNRAPYRPMTIDFSQNNHLVSSAVVETLAEQSHTQVTTHFVKSQLPRGNGLARRRHLE
ncbi:MAG: AfsA-related hotdog domain-containing protein [Ancrocorticia sp.]|uniref:AfsA-related hotdog domain-containing protein n=1 Tax=Ancrocorticia sp. TaxID=2593684 RepID=UPI003F93CC74